MRGFLDMPSRTHGRTHGRTDKRESIGLSAEAERPIISIQVHTKKLWAKLQSLPTILKCTLKYLVQNPPIVYIFGKFTKIVYSRRKIAGHEKCRGKGGGTQISDLGWGETRFSENPKGNLTLHTLCIDGF